MRKISISILLSMVLSFFSFTSFAQTGDPWIKKAYNMLYMRDPLSFEYNIQNYNGGSWNNYNELVQYIIQYTKTLTSKGLGVTITPAGNGKSLAVFTEYGKPFGVDLISNDGGSIVASGAGNIVASGAGNIVTNATGNLKSLPGVSFGNNYGHQEVGTRRIPISGKVAWVIK